MSLQTASYMYTNLQEIKHNNTLTVHSTTYEVIAKRVAATKEYLTIHVWSGVKTLDTCISTNK